MPGGRPRGGRRQGAVGKAYQNRSDLNGPRPVTAPPSSGYGERKALEDAQAAVPMGTPEVAGGWHPSQGRPEGMPPPGSLGDLFADSENPDEHVMNGAALGPGLGPQAFAGPDTRDLDLEHMAPYLPALREMASRPNASPALVQYVRRLVAG